MAVEKRTISRCELSTARSGGLSFTEVTIPLSISCRNEDSWLSVSAIGCLLPVHWPSALFLFFGHVSTICRSPFRGRTASQIARGLRCDWDELGSLFRGKLICNQFSVNDGITVGCWRVGGFAGTWLIDVC